MRRCCDGVCRRTIINLACRYAPRSLDLFGLFAPRREPEEPRQAFCLTQADPPRAKWPVWVFRFFSHLSKLETAKEQTCGTREART